MLGKIFSIVHIDIFFLLPRKQDLTFLANCGDNLCEMSNHVFLRKLENIISLQFVELVPRVVSDAAHFCIHIDAC